MNTFNNLKRLKIRLKPGFDLEIFNKFSNTLEQLEIENNQRELKLIKDTVLNLPELKKIDHFFYIIISIYFRN